MDLDEVSAKIRTGPPVDDEEDYALPVWAGVLPVSSRARDARAGPAPRPGCRVACLSAPGWCRAGSAVRLSPGALAPDLAHGKRLDAVTLEPKGEAARAAQRVGPDQRRAVRAALDARIADHQGRRARSRLLERLGPARQGDARPPRLTMQPSASQRRSACPPRPSAGQGAASSWPALCSQLSVIQRSRFQGDSESRPPSRRTATI